MGVVIITEVITTTISRLGSVSVASLDLHPAVHSSIGRARVHGVFLGIHGDNVILMHEQGQKWIGRADLFTEYKIVRISL